MPITPIRRIRTPSPEEFYREYVHPGVPVILTDLFDHAPLRRVDTLAAAAAALGAVELEIQPNYMTFLTTGQRGEPRRMSLGDYLERVHAEPDTPDLCVEYATPPALAEWLPAPALCSWQNPADVVSATFVANRGNYNHLHFDDDQRSVLLYQVFGAKRFLLIDPEPGHRLDAFMVPRPEIRRALARTPARDANGRIYFEHLDPDERAAMLDYLGAYEVLLAPGEALFMPLLWWHHVEYVDTSMSITYRLGRNEFNRRLATAMPMPDIFSQRVGYALRDARHAEHHHGPALRSLMAACDGPQVAPACAAAYEAMFAESAATRRAVRELYLRGLDSDSSDTSPTTSPRLQALAARLERARVVDEAPSLGARARQILSTAATALDAPHDILAGCLERMSRNWNTRRLDDPPRWCGLTLDRTPIEFSANFDRKGHSLRFSVEAQAEPATPASYWDAALALHAALRERHDISTEAFDAVAEWYRPRHADPLLAVWHAVAAGRAARANFKAYVSPSPGGPGGEAELIARTLARLDLADAGRSLPALRDDATAWSLVCIDLPQAGTRAGIKLYERFLGLDRAWLEARVHPDDETPYSALARFVARLSDGGRDLPWGVLSYAIGHDRPPRTTVHVPIDPHAPQTPVRARVVAAMEEFGIDARPYRRLLDQATRAGTPLFHTYVSFQHVGGAPRITAYLSPRFYQARHGVLYRPRWTD